MRRAMLVAGAAGFLVFVSMLESPAQDWPQWRGPDRSARAGGFEAPDAWPESLARRWSVSVGDGVASPSLVGNRLYVFTLQEGNEILRCLDAETGEEMWRVQYEAEGADGAARSFAGPRSSPAAGEDLVVTLGVRGTFSCLDAETGEILWRREDFNSWPRFFTSSSPIIVDGMCIAQVGGEEDGKVVALDLVTGDEQWTWSGEGTAYSSPVLLEMDGEKVIAAMTTRSVIGLSVTDGELLWQTPFVVRGRGYNAATPIVHGDRLILAGSGRGTRATAIHKKGDTYAASEVWANEEQSVQFNTPIIKDGKIFGLSDGNQVFCIQADSGETSWTAPLSDSTATPPEAGREEGGGQGQGRRRGRGRGHGRGMAGSGYGSIVDAGSVLFALTPSGELVVFEPDATEFKVLARYKVSENATHAYPVISGQRIFVKDQDAVTLWTLGGS